MLITVLPPAFAFNCEPLEGEQHELCLQIEQLNMTEQEKEMLLTMAFYNEREIPNHDFVAFWNEQLIFTSAPANVTIQQTEVIKKAWLKIVSAMPSVKENDTLFCTRNGKLQTAYNYTTQLPSGTRPGDCYTTYQFSGDRTTFRTLVNGEQFGTEKLSFFNLDSGIDEAQFLSRLDIIVDTRVNHYRNHRYCCKHSHGTCVKYCWRCEYDYYEIQTDSLTLSDTINATVYDEDPEGNAEITSNLTSSYRGEFSAFNTTRIILSFENSSYKKSDYVYDFNYSLKPYNALTLVAIPQIQEETHNIFIYGQEPKKSFIVQNPRNCSLVVADHFLYSPIICDSNILDYNLSITINEFYYKSNDTILVNITPNNLPVTLSYGNQTIVVQNSASFVAAYPFNKITATYEDERSEVFFSVTEPHSILLASKIFLFGLMNYILFNFLTKSHLISPWLIVD